MLFNNLILENANRFFTLDGWNELQEAIASNPVCLGLENYFIGLEKPMGSKPVRFRLMWHVACHDMMCIGAEHRCSRNGIQLLHQFWRKRRNYFCRWGEASCLLFMYWYLLGGMRKQYVTFSTGWKDNHLALHRCLITYGIPMQLRRSAKRQEKALLYEDRKNGDCSWLLDVTAHIMGKELWFV